MRQMQSVLDEIVSQLEEKFEATDFTSHV